MNTADTFLWIEPELPLAPCRSDRDRDFFDLGDALLAVASDRISHAGHLFPEGIPDRGRIRTQLARFWAEAVESIIPSHILTYGFAALPEPLLPFRDRLEGRSLVVRKLRPLTVGCVVRGYLAGSAFRDYMVDGSVAGLTLPPRLKLAARLPEPIFTPSISLGDGRRRNITMAELMNHVGARMTKKLKETSLALYMRGYHLAWERGIILADSRFEFGQAEGGKLVLTDEVLTPDTCRYWREDLWKPGAAPPSLGCGCLQDFLDSLPALDDTATPSHLPQHVVDGIRHDHAELARRFGIAA